MKTSQGVTIIIISIVIGAIRTVPKGLGRNNGGIGNQKNRDHPDHSFVKIRLNTQKSLGDLRRLAVSQTLLKYHLLKLTLV